MLISLNWLRDFVDLPAGLDPRELAKQFTITTAEVEGVERHSPNFDGLIAVRIESMRGTPGADAGAIRSPTAEAMGHPSKLQGVVVDAGSRKYNSLTSAPDIKVGDLVAFAPPGSSVGGHNVEATRLAGGDAHPTQSEGMIVAWGSLGFTEIGAHAIFLPPQGPSPANSRCHKPGDVIDPKLFDDWVIEVDNKSITHRPDCWGHYGIAREVAAMLQLPLKPYEVTPIDGLGGAAQHRHGQAALDRATSDSHRLIAGATNSSLPAIPIEIDDPAKCPRYTALLMKGLKSQPAPLWMQARLAVCGQRPIDLLVDLTNYIMLELGQPMHAFDGAKLANIQVATAKPGEKFVTLDGITRTMPPGTLMIQCNRKSVAIAGIMGGAETEVSRHTDTILLESANFDAPTIRRAATAMGHRTEASARFEKSLDPAHTVLGIARFHRLAKAELPGLEPASTLSDCYPAPKRIDPIELDCARAVRVIGKDVPPERIIEILTKLEFACEPIRAPTPKGGGPPGLLVTPPSFRATKDISIEADLIEEIARFVGYNNIEPTLPQMTARHFAPSADLILEERTLDHLCTAGPFVEVHDYIWFDDAWLAKIGFDSGECVTLKNPAAEGSARLRTSLIPGMLSIAERNRHHFDRFRIAQIGSVFFAGRKEVEESQERRLALLVAEAGKKADAVVWDDMRLALDAWARQALESAVTLKSAKVSGPWEDGERIAEVVIGGEPVGRITLLPLAIKQRIDERLKAWSISLAEIRLPPLVRLLDKHEKLPSVPRYPLVRLDFSALTANRYEHVASRVADFKHPRLRRLSFVEAYQGGAIPEGRRSLTFRAEIGLDDRTLTEQEIHEFRDAFTKHLSSAGLELRG